VLVAVTDGPGILPEVAARLAAGGLRIADLALRRPTLDDVFLALTGQPTPAATSAASPGRASGEAAATAAPTTATSPAGTAARQHPDPDPDPVPDPDAGAGRRSHL
jgi:hypothetical protein